MRLPARTPVFAHRLLAGIVPVAAVVASVVVAKPPAPVAPGEPGASVRFQNPLPPPHEAPKNGNGEKIGEATSVSDQFAETGPELTLGQCVAIALERQPTLKAVAASTAAVEAAHRALNNLGPAATILSPDLDIRKQQAKRGLMATSAEYQKLHNEVVQDVTRLYYTAVYARQQQRLAESVVIRLQFLVDYGRKLLEEIKDPKLLEGFTVIKLRVMEDGLLQAKKLYSTAKLGRQKALAGLREVMGVDARNFPFRPYDDPQDVSEEEFKQDPSKARGLPVMKQNVAITSERVAEMALERRPELVLAAAGVDAFRLEVYAQGKISFRRVVPTLASGADIHAKPIPPELRTTNEYRPGGIIPEMPVQLVGSKYDRVCRAMAFAQRAEAVYEKARNLIVLEAENTYFDFQQASERLDYAKQQYDLSKKIQDLAQAAQIVTKAQDQIVQAEVVAARAQSDYLQAVHEYLLALAALERVTAGGIRPEFPGR